MEKINQRSETLTLQKSCIDMLRKIDPINVSNHAHATLKCYSSLELLSGYHPKKKKFEALKE